MSKRAQTTGAPKRRRRRQSTADGSPASIQQGAEYRSRAEQEAILQRRVIRGSIIAAIALALLVVGAFVVEQLIIPSQTVAQVNGEPISVDEFRQAYLFERNRLLLQLNQVESAGFDLQQLAQQEPYRTWINEANVPDQLGLRVINDLVDERLLAAEAAARGIAVDDADIQNAVEDYFGFDPTAVAQIGMEPSATPEPSITPTPFVSPTPTATSQPTATPDPDATAAPTGTPTITPQPTVVDPTQTADEVRESFEQNQSDYRAYFDRAGVNSETYDQFFAQNALENRLAEALLPDDTPLIYADVRHILVEDEATALAALEALNAGESFAALASAISTDSGSGRRGGELGESFIGNYVRPFREAIANAEIGALVGPVESEFGFHILQVRHKEERTGADQDSQRERARQSELNDLQEQLREDNSDSIEIYDSWLDYMPSA
ncbi:MAG: hypothetical protein F4Y30_15185 [Chloroflexi bacterium]|nr:hypothetical protein [Chloroflexota bacterium]MYA94742.1 hypothetical protein [Chloroflexota bacterium]MYC54092.1 hypothetical protein [Chloroflexota bacterium]MYE77943.1 hypothetical protein [Chloroflexota bacterium]MYH64667.1 hypothetical protein [Chloroflexota bacterium]